jgi:hypothetical protein
VAIISLLCILRFCERALGGIGWLYLCIFLGYVHSLVGCHKTEVVLSWRAHLGPVSNYVASAPYLYLIGVVLALLTSDGSRDVGKGVEPSY